MKLCHAVLFAIAAVLVYPAKAQQTTDSPPQADETLLPYMDTASSVLLADGREFHFVCMGEGAPTVILTAGSGDWSVTWKDVQARIAETTRACAWDRPGFGLTDAAAGKQTVAITAADLEAALTRGAVEGPYVLVGHSLGSYESLLYADRNRALVAGMVLVDPSVPDQMELMASVAPALAATQGEMVAPVIAEFRRCAEAVANTGAFAVDDADVGACLLFPPVYPPALREALAAKRADPLYYEARASFFETTTESGQLVVNSDRDYGDMPLIVLTATIMQPLPPNIPEEAGQQLAAFFGTAWNEAHDALAALSTRGINARVPGSSHYIHQDNPQVVIDAISNVVALTRTSSP